MVSSSVGLCVGPPRFSYVALSPLLVFFTGSAFPFPPSVAVVLWFFHPTAPPFHPQQFIRNLRSCDAPVLCLRLLPRLSFVPFPVYPLACTLPHSFTPVFFGFFGVQVHSSPRSAESFFLYQLGPFASLFFLTSLESAATRPSPLFRFPLYSVTGDTFSYFFFHPSPFLTPVSLLCPVSHLIFPSPPLFVKPFTVTPCLPLPLTGSFH